MGSPQFSYGGQAVLEGVMIRGRNQATVAVRQPTGVIAFKHFPLDIQRRDRWEHLPLLRGVVMLWDMLNLGTRALNFSMVAATGEQEEMTKGSSIGMFIVALAFAIGLFFIVPMLLASLMGYFGASLFLRELIEGVVRLGLIVAYVVSIRRITEVQRLFGFHGAEHKVVNAYEAGAPLNVETVRTFTLIHPRCGTSFLVVVVLISFVIFLFFGWLPFWMRLLSRVIFVPVIAAVAYEVLRLSAAHYHRPWIRTLLVPSLFFQRLTTCEPDDSMIMTAIAALQAVLTADGVVDQNFRSSDEAVLAVSNVM